MRGEDNSQESLFIYVSMEKRMPDDHPLRPIRTLVDEVFGRMSRKFADLCSDTGRPSIPPEQLLRALVVADGMARPRGSSG